MKKKKKEPNSVTTNLNILINKDFCAYPQSRTKNTFKALETQLKPDEFKTLKALYSQIDTENPDTDYDDFTAYVKNLIRKYAKNK